jgi:endo-alpha-1,4-polygalactosaminidase (GH114 family)
MKMMSRSLSSLCLAATLVTGVPADHAVCAGMDSFDSQKQGSLAGIDSYTVYYGEPKRSLLPKLSTYDLVVIEPRLWTKEQVDSLKQKGVKVIGYLSVLEQHKSSALLKHATEEDYLKVGGRREFREQWHSWSMNINSRHYRELLFADYRAQVIEKGLDGVFLDTMGNADDQIWPDDISDRQREGSVEFVKSLRSAYPERVIIQNWGLTKLKDRTAPYIDGILWEDFEPDVVSRDEWSQDRMKELADLKRKHGLTVLTVDVGLTGKQKAGFAALNRKLGYVGQVIKRNYDEL